MLLLKNAHIYSPYDLGIQDILINNNKIIKIGKINVDNANIIDCSGKIITPMFIDGHEHITMNTCSFAGIIKAGVSTVVGVLANESGKNGVKALQQNLDIAREMRSFGIDAYCLTGGKVYPCNNLLGSLEKDILEIPEVVGVKTALNSIELVKGHNPTYEQFKEIVLEVFNASKKTNKKLQIHIHLENLKKRKEIQNFAEQVNNGKLDNLSWIDKIHNELGVPYSMFKITHAFKCLKRAIEYANKGCYIDYTAFHSAYDTMYDDMVEAVRNRTVDVSKVSISSDLAILTCERGWQGEETPFTILHTVKTLVKEKNLMLEDVLKMVTINAINPIKEQQSLISEQEECKILILNQDLTLSSILLGENLSNLKSDELTYEN